MVGIGPSHQAQTHAALGQADAPLRASQSSEKPLNRLVNCRERPMVWEQSYTLSYNILYFLISRAAIKWQINHFTQLQIAINKIATQAINTMTKSIFLLKIGEFSLIVLFQLLPLPLQPRWLTFEPKPISVCAALAQDELVES
jgi:hypothetical protein